MVLVIFFWNFQKAQELFLRKAEQNQNHLQKKKPKKRIELQIEEIVKKWEQGVTQKELSKEYGVSEALIGRRISENIKKPTVKDDGRT